MSNHPEALKVFEILLKKKRERIENSENLEICHAMSDVGDEMRELGRFKDSLKIYSEVYGLKM